MSQLEDIYLEDEADNDFERVIEGDEDVNNRVESENESDGNKEDEAEEDKRKVDPSKPKKKAVKNPHMLLNPARLTGPRGIHTIQNYFTNFKFQGKGHESEDLDLVLKKLEHWAHRLYPKFQFDDCLEKIETLGKKRAVMTQVKKIRFNLLEQENESVLQKDSSDEEGVAAPVQEPDEFDKLLEQQIELARSTPASVNKGPFGRNVVSDSPRQVPNKEYFADDDGLGVSHIPQTPIPEIQTHVQKQTKENGLSEEQKQRMLRNRIFAEERRLARMKKTAMEEMEIVTNASNTVSPSSSETVTNANNTVSPSSPETVTNANNTVSPSSSETVTNANNTVSPSSSETVTNANNTVSPSSSETVTNANNTVSPSSSETVTNANNTVSPSSSKTVTNANNTVSPSSSETVTNANKTVGPLSSETVTNANNIASPSSPATVTNANNTVSPSSSETITMDTEEIATSIQDMKALSHVSKDFELNMADSVNDYIDFNNPVCENNTEKNGKRNIETMDLDTVCEETTVETGEDNVHRLS